MSIDTSTAGVGASTNQAEPPESGHGRASPRASTVGARWAPWAAWLIGAIVVVPILVSGVDGLLRDWFPAGDWAMTELRVLDVGTGRTPLVGPYSRFGWNHPGPMLFWLLAVPYRASGGLSSSLLWTASLINAGSVAGMLALAWRRGRLPLLAILAVALTLCSHTLAAGTLRDPWNAWVTVLPFGLLILAAWSAFEGDRVGLIVLAVVASFLSQSHVGFVPIVVALTAVGVVGFVRRVPGRRMPLIAGGVLALCWLPVLVGTLSGDGNLVMLVAHFAGGNSGVPAGLGDAWGVMALELGGWGPWLGSEEEINPSGGSLLPGSSRLLIVPALAWATAAAVAWRRRRETPEELSLLVIIVGCAAIGVLAISRITGGVFDYLVRWWWPLAALWWVAVIWVLGRAAFAGLVSRSARLSGARRWALPALALVCLAVSAGYAFETTSVASTARLPVDDWGPSMAALTQGHPPDHDRPVLVRTVGPLAGWASDAYTVQLARAGVDFRVDDSGINRQKFGAPRLWRGEADLPVIWVVTGSWIDDFDRTGTGRRLAGYDPLSASERAVYRASEHRVRLAFRAAGREDLEHALDDGQSLQDAAMVPGMDAGDIRTVEDGRRRGVPVALYEVADPSVSLPAHEP